MIKLCEPVGCLACFVEKINKSYHYNFENSLEKDEV